MAIQSMFFFFVFFMYSPAFTIVLILGCNDLKTKDLSTLQKPIAGVFGLQFSPDGKYLALAIGWVLDNKIGGEIRLLDTSNWKVVSHLGSGSTSFYRLAYSPNGRILAAGGDDSHVYLWDVDKRKSISVLKGHKNAVHDVAFSPDGKLLASGSWDDTIKLWDTASWKETATLEGHKDSVMSVAFSPIGKLLATGAADGRAKLWDLETYKERMSWEAGEGRVTSVVFLPNGKLLAVACWKSIQLWDVLNGKSVAKLDSHTDKVWCLAVSSDSKILVSVAWDGMMILWDLAQRKELAKLDRSKENDEKFQSVTLRCVALSRDGKMIVTCGTYRFKDGQQVDRVKVWDLTNQRVCVSLDISPP